MDGHHLQKTFLFPDFVKGLDFVNRAEAPWPSRKRPPSGSVALSWGKVDVVTYTHKINGLTESDFILAAKIDRAFAAQ